MPYRGNSLKSSDILLSNEIDVRNIKIPHEYSHIKMAIEIKTKQPIYILCYLKQTLEWFDFQIFDHILSDLF